jgi:hypothetical protein
LHTPLAPGRAMTVGRDAASIEATPAAGVAQCREIGYNRAQAIAPPLLLLGVTVYASKRSRRFD